MIKNQKLRTQTGSCAPGAPACIPRQPMQPPRAASEYRYPGISEHSDVACEDVVSGTAQAPMASPLVFPVVAAITSAATLHSVFLPQPLVTIIICTLCVCIHYITSSRPDSVACCANTAFALSAAGAAGLRHALEPSHSSNFGLFVAVLALYHCGEFFAIALSKPANVDNFGD